MDVEMRTATENDLPSILRLYAQPELDDGAMLTIETAKSLFRKIASYPAYFIFVASSEQRVVGSLALLIMDNLGHLGAPSAIIEAVAVEPEMQGKGIGTAMMLHALDICRQYKCYKVALSANLKRTRAHAFYESLGWKKHGYSYVIDEL